MDSAIHTGYSRSYFTLFEASSFLMQKCEKACNINVSLCPLTSVCSICAKTIWCTDIVNIVCGCEIYKQLHRRTQKTSTVHQLMDSRTNEEWWGEQTLTVNEFSCIEQEVGHEDPVDHHRTNQWHQWENKTRPFSESPKVIFTHIRKLPVWGVYIRCKDRAAIYTGLTLNTCCFGAIVEIS